MFSVRNEKNNLTDKRVTSNALWQKNVPTMPFKMSTPKTYLLSALLATESSLFKKDSIAFRNFSINYNHLLVQYL